MEMEAISRLAYRIQSCGEPENSEAIAGFMISISISISKFNKIPNNLILRTPSALSISNATHGVQALFAMIWSITRSHISLHLGANCAQQGNPHPPNPFCPVNIKCHTSIPDAGILICGLRWSMSYIGLHYLNVINVTNGLYNLFQIIFDVR